MLNKAERAILKKYKDAIRQFAEEVSFQIEKGYEDAIEAFYADYGPNNGEPWVYKRTLSTYSASSSSENPFDPKNIRESGDYFSPGTIVSSKYIPGNPYRAEKDWVFGRTFYKGIHGINIVTVRRRNSTLKQKAEEKGIKLKDTKGLIKVRSKFSTADFDPTYPSNMKPAPKILMDRYFRQLTKKKNMDKMLNDIMKNVL